LLGWIDADVGAAPCGTIELVDVTASLVEQQTGQVAEEAEA